MKKYEKKFKEEILNSPIYQKSIIEFEKYLSDLYREADQKIDEFPELEKEITTSIASDLSYILEAVAKKMNNYSAFRIALKKLKRIL